MMNCFPSSAIRIKQLEEAVQIIRLMWTETAPTFIGEYFAIHEAYCSPRPPVPSPIMIAGDGEQLMLPLIARQADWWNTSCWSMQDVATYAPKYQRKRDLLFQHAEAAGRDPATIVQTFAIINSWLPRSSDDSARWLDLLRPLIALGITHIMLDGRAASPEPVLRFAEEVIVPLQRT